jgi:hypothetical protein
MSKIDQRAKTIKQGTYYLGRVILAGNLDKKKFVEALQNPINLEHGDYKWTITNFKKVKLKNDNYFVFGNLSKYDPKGEVAVVDTKSHLKKAKKVEDAEKASSPFVYLPEYSGIAYLHVWNQIQQEAFIRRFKDLVEKHYHNFFVEMNIEAVGDPITFSKRIAELSSIELIQARVRPPNPLFGPLWGPLKKYLKERNLAEFKVEEKADKGEKISTKLASLLAKVEDEKAQANTPPLDITDAAILMATDGYGSGKVHGIENKRKVVIHTSDAIKNFKFDTDPDPEKLYEIAEAIFREITDKRHMKHEKPNH